jgi:hypothetical protein
VVLAHDSRTLELAEYHGIPHRTISEDTDCIDPAEIYAGADYAELNAGHAGRWHTFSQFLDQHGLRTVYDEGEDRGARFDTALAAVHFPPPVRTPINSSPEELYQMRRELTELRMRIAELESGQVRNSRVARNPDSFFHRTSSSPSPSKSSPQAPTASVGRSVRKRIARTVRRSRKRLARLARVGRR